MPVAPFRARLCPKSWLLVLVLAGLPSAARAAHPFIDNGDGTVTDSSTSLVWDQCAWGQTGALCADTPASAHTWRTALVQARAANAVAHKGYTDWRLPNAAELGSLADLDKLAQPRIDTSVFFGAPSGDVWSSTFFWPSAGTPVDSAWAMAETGAVSTLLIAGSGSVRLVRGGPSAASFHDALDTVPPVATLATATATGATAAALSLRASEPGQGYWWVRPASSPAPTPAQMLASGTAVAMLGGTTYSATPGGLAPGSDYVLYFWPRDTAGNGAVSVVSRSFSTPKQAQTITFGGLAARNFGQSVPALSAIASSGETVAFASLSPSVCSVSGTAVALLAAGNCRIEATQPGNATYSAAPGVEQSFTVSAVVPGAPVGGSGAQGDASVTLVWGPPAFGGGSPVSYTVTGGPAGPVVCASPCTVAGLLNGTAYSFTVTAGNSAGAGGSLALGPFTPLAVAPAGATPIPTLSQLGLWLLAVLLAVGAWRRRV